MPWGVILEFVLEHPELGWILLFGWLFLELRTPYGRFFQLDKKITGAIIVIRALAKKDDLINEEAVDDYLVENGMEPEDFFTESKAFPDTVVEDSSSQQGESTLGDNDNSPNNDERST